ncbi:MAG: PQQ-like beta-propeller repeat protein, partial [Armatimonadetes bacterium]|nr:PQQ-like beta-propeller repeat protein [Armatimonadota bacterium]
MPARRVPVLFVLMIVFAAAAQSQVKRVTRPLLRPSQYHGTRFFPSLKWRVTIGMTANTTPALADLDLDGTMDMVVPGADGNLYRLTADGNVKWKVALPGNETSETALKKGGGEETGDDNEEGAEKTSNEPTASPGAVGVTLGDADRDGNLDILLAVENLLLCFSADGKEQWRVELSEPINSFPTIADLEGDGKPEVLVGANDNRLHVLTGKGEEEWTFETKSWIMGGVAVSDLDGDGRLEVVFGSMDRNVYCLNSKGKLEWKFGTEDWVQASPCIADVDRDGRKDVVIASDDGSIYCLSHRGTLKWKETLGKPQHSRPYLAVADLDGEGTLETIVCLPEGNVMVYTAFGDRAWVRSMGAPVLGSPLIADLNGDGWQDLLVAT